MICVFNAHFGSPARLPFDLVHRRYPVQYTLSPSSTPEERENQFQTLTESLTKALGVIVRKLGMKGRQTLDDAPSHAVAALTECTFQENGPLAQTKSQDHEGRENDYVFWHHGPMAWLRLIPAHSRNFSRAQLIRFGDRSQAELRPFGPSWNYQVHPNGHGIVSIGYDDTLPTIATEATQVFQSGEIWGLNHTLIEPQRTEPTRTFQIPWPLTQQLFQATLASYMELAQRTLELPLPIIVVAGLGMVDQALFTPAKHSSYAAPHKPVRCLEQFISSRILIDRWDVPQTSLLDPFFTKVLDACGLDYEVWRTKKWAED